MSLQEALLFYHNQKLPVIPCNNKKPSIPWTEFQNRIPTQKEISDWNKLSFNGIGLVTGIQSKVAVIDVDSKDLSKLPIELPNTLVAETKHGFHYYYQYPDLELKNSNQKSNGLVIADVRAEGGFVVMPPSQNYTWTNTKYLSISELSPFPESAIKLIQSKIKISWDELKNKKIEIGERNDSAASYIGGLIKSKYWRNPNDAWSDTKIWNQTQCLIPLAENELRATFESIVRRELNSRKSQSLYSPIYSNDLSDSLTFTEKYQVVDAVELETKVKTKIEWIVPGLIPADGITFIAGNPKSGKSLLSLHLAQILSTGTKFLGHFNVRPSKVLLVSMEDGEVLVNSRLISRSKNLIVCTKGNFSLDTYDGQQDLLSGITQIKPDVLILDSFRRFIRGNENDSEVTNAFHQSAKLFLNAGVKAIVVIHHIGKPKENYKSAQNLRGSSDIWAMLDSFILIERKKDVIEVSQPSCRAARPLPSFLIKSSDNSPTDLIYLSTNHKNPNKNEKVESRISQILSDGTPRKQIEIITEIKKVLTDVSATTIKNTIKKMPLKKNVHFYSLPEKEVKKN